MSLNQRKELLILQLLSSDSSSDEEDGVCEILEMLEQELLPKRKKVMRINRKRRSPQSSSLDGEDLRIIRLRKNKGTRTELDNISETLLMNYINDWKQIGNEEFRKLFRLSKLCFAQLLNKFESFQDSRQKLQPTEKRSTMLLIFLLLAGHQLTIYALAEKMHIYRSNCMVYIDFALEFLIGLKDAVVRIPQLLEDKQRIADEFFNMANLKNVIGCIEKINFRFRAHNANTAINYDEAATFPVDIICDASGRFLANDFEILDSKLAKHCDGNYCFLASLKYPLREWTITPCQADDHEPRSVLHADQQLFNNKFYSTYKVLPQSINKLQERFSHLKCIDTNRVMYARRFLSACIVLYNFAIDCNDNWQTDAVVDDDIMCNQPPVSRDSLSCPVVKTELERFKCPKGTVKRDRMIYESCILDAVDVIEQEIEIE